MRRKPPGLSISCSAEQPSKPASFKFSGSGTFSVTQGKNGSFKISINQTGGISSPLGRREFPGLALNQIDSLHELGSGSSGCVKLARHKPSGRLLALKVLTGLAAREQRHLLVNELRVMCKLAHPNLVPYYDCFQLDGIAYLALKYMNGGSLEHCCSRYRELAKEEGGPSATGLPELVLSSVAMQALCGLAHLHAKGLIHLDLKPANMLIDSATGTVALADFGISKDVRHEDKGQASAFVGSAAYMAPERLTGQSYTSAADMWALGMVLLECAQGVHPWASAGSLLDMVVNISDPQIQPPRLPDDGSFGRPLREMTSRLLQPAASERPTAQSLLRHEFVLPAVVVSPPPHTSGSDGEEEEEEEGEEEEEEGEDTDGEDRAEDVHEIDYDEADGVDEDAAASAAFATASAAVSARRLARWLATTFGPRVDPMAVSAPATADCDPRRGAGSVMLSFIESPFPTKAEYERYVRGELDLPPAGSKARHRADGQLEGMASHEPFGVREAVGPALGQIEEELAAVHMCSQ